MACGDPAATNTADATAPIADVADTREEGDGDVTAAPDAADTRADAEDAADGGDADDDARVDTTPPDPDLDSDRDGVRDLEELAAGTDPFDPASAPAWHPERTARPRLHLDAADLPALRALAASDDPAATTLLARIRAYAARTPPDWPEVDPWESGTSTLLARIAETQAFLGLLDQDPDASAAAAALLAAPYPDPTPLNAGVYPDSHYNLYESEALVAACHAYDLLAGTPGLPAADLAAAHDRLAPRVDTFAAMMLEPGAFNTFLLLAQNNHLMKVFAALGVCAIALPDRPDAARDLNEAVTGLTYLLFDVQATPDGGYAEGWNYLAYGGQSWLALIWAWRRFLGPEPGWPLYPGGAATPSDTASGAIADYGDLAAHPTFRAMFRAALQTARPDGLCLPTDDANVVPLPTLLAAALLNEPALAANAALPAVAFDAGALDVLTFSALPQVPAPAPPAWPLDEVLDEAGFAVFRSDRGPDATLLVLLGEHGRARSAGIGHEHADSLALLLHAHGEPLAIDPAYVDFEHHDLVKRGRDHNIVLVDGEGPPFPFEVTAPSGDAWLGPLEGDAARTTVIGRTAYLGVTLWRRVLRVDGATFVVADRVVADDGAPRTYTFALNGLGGGDVPDGSFTLAADGATWTRPLAALRVVTAATNGALTTTSRLEEHATAHGTFALHATLDASATMATDAGFLTLLEPEATGAAPAAVTVAQVAPGVALATRDSAGVVTRFASNTTAQAAVVAVSGQAIAVPPGLSELGPDGGVTRTWPLVGP
ncbi:MAG: hypothetical protein CVU56_27155 [Deltaproteobacteria bacterium HGW-Deltaproteobacteria-14]|nr:MAG: hypothetical protein CVU56_27155 [Deltaproteobacteria bacterium HGW-Deltaproteobacteria-14]